jgi:ubiquitin-protein ligase
MDYNTLTDYNGNMRLYKEMKKLYKKGELDLYWQISENNDFDMNIQLVELNKRTFRDVYNEEDYIINLNLNITYPFKSSNITYPFHYINTRYIGLPSDVNTLISDFLPNNHMVNLQFKINIPDDYPFVSPIVSIELANTNMNTHLPDILSFYEYYNYLTKNINSSYKKEWNPAMKLDTYLLSIISFINHFNEIIKYKRM